MKIAEAMIVPDVDHRRVEQAELTLEVGHLRARCSR